MRRRTAGKETWRRLLEWDRGQTAAERLAAQILRFDGFLSIDPSHPLGGPDGLKDVVCRRGSEKWIGAAYFPRGQQSVRQITDKLAVDIEGVSLNGASGIAFVTNQELTLTDRATLTGAHSPAGVEIYHLERIASLLDSPPCYGLRLEFLDIEMTKEEQLSFMAAKDLAVLELKETMEAMSARLSQRPPVHASPQEIPTVTPMSIGFQSGSTAGLFGNRYVDCKNCKGIFQVQSSGLPSFSTMVGGLQAVSCPFCGRTQRWDPF